MILQLQNGRKIYSDGNETELNMLKIAQEYPEDLSQDYIAEDSRYTINNTFSAVRHNILNWYPFNSNADILEIGAGMGALTGMLCDKCKSVTSIEMNELRADVIRARYKERKNLKVLSEDINIWKTNEKFDYIVFIGVLEYAGIFSDGENPFETFLTHVKHLLKKEGIVLFAIENRFGLKYWCGASEDHLQKPYVGLDGYKNPETPVTFSKCDLTKMAQNVGFNNSRFYYVLPDYKFPQVIFTDEFQPSSHEIENVLFTYGRDSQLTLNEKELYKSIFENNVYDFFANSFLVEMSESVLPKKHVIYVSARGECKKEYRIITTIDNQDNVIKSIAHEKAKDHLKNTYDNGEYLKKRGISTLNVKFTENQLMSKRFHGAKADGVLGEYLKKNDFNSVCKLLEDLRDCIIKSSPVSTTNSNIITQNSLSSETFDYGIILEKGFIDMTFYNAFYENGELIFFDQEWCFEDVPAKFILYYAVKSAYSRLRINSTISFEKILYYLNIHEERKIYDDLEDFIWSRILNRSGDIYGEDGYCNIYNESMTLNSMLEKKEMEKINEIKKSYQIILNKDAHIELLLKSDRELAAIKSSRAWRLMNFIWRIRDRIIPYDSKRRLFAKMMVKTIKRPSTIFSNFNSMRIRKFFYYLKNEGVSGVSHRIDKYLQDTSIKPMDLNIIDFKEIKEISDCEKLNFLQVEKPIVSIIIPVYNQFTYTYQCLGSILKNSGNISYEVIIANDCSTDLTTKIEEVAKNVIVINNTKNIHFLRNCNYAAKYAKGKYILFLNNDTQVQENWLNPLVELIERDLTIGMVGSKLVYADGQLQEAGGIVWDDGSAWNYGRLSNNSNPEFNYVKEVDYISGASIMISKELWDSIGGFDERYVPAYYEDTDLAFEVRKRGYKVMYQPQSVVVHFEGISNGTDIKSGSKAYQIENRKKFYEKWKHVLKEEHFQNGKNIFFARDKSTRKKHILVIDHYIPHYDKDAGGKCTFMYIKLFIKLGMRVTFIGDNFYKHEPYASELEQMGVEILYGNFYSKNCNNWLKENVKYFDYVYLNRPHISIKYIDIIKEYSNAKIIYFGLDLHYLRVYRQYEIEKDPDLLNESNEWKKIEWKLFSMADVIHVVGSYEENILKVEFPDKIIRNIPVYLYDGLKENINTDFNTRKDIIFVGGFVHSPNVDAVLWFEKEIFEKIVERHPDIRWFIVGSNPPESVNKLTSKNIIVTGFISDKELSTLYETCRIAVVPLRVGAGVKGKVIEAVYNRIPIITTSIGAEGLSLTEEAFVVADGADNFANAIIDLYDNTERLLEISRNCNSFIDKYFTSKIAEKIVRKDIDI